MTPNFRFELEPVLEHRRRRETERGRELREVRTALEDARLALDRLEDQLRRSRRGEGGTTRGGSVADFHRSEHLAALLEAHVERARDRCEEFRGRLREVERAYREAVREREVLNRLRERHLTEWREERDRRDQGRMDEIALHRWAPRDENPKNGGEAR